MKELEIKKEIESKLDSKLNWIDRFQNEIGFIINYNDCDNIYNKLKQGAKATNFGGNPYEQMSFIKFKDYVIYPPKVATNGDNNWYQYPKNIKLLITITIN